MSSPSLFLSAPPIPDGRGQDLWPQEQKQVEQGPEVSRLVQPLLLFFFFASDRRRSTFPSLPSPQPSPPLSLEKKTKNLTQLRPAAPEVSPDGPQGRAHRRGAPQAEEEARGRAGPRARVAVRVRRDQAAQAAAGRRPEVGGVRVLPRGPVREGVQVQVLARPGGGAEDEEDRPVLGYEGGRRRRRGGRDGGLGPR